MEISLINCVGVLQKRPHIKTQTVAYQFDESHGVIEKRKPPGDIFVSDFYDD